MTHAPSDATTAYERIRALRDASGLRRVHVFTFRDLEAPDAGGSEEHARQLCSHLAAAGIEVTMHTGAVAGRPAEIERQGFRVVRRGGRVGVYLRTPLDARFRLGPRDGIIEVAHGLPFFVPLWAPRTPQVLAVHHVHLGTWQMLLPGIGGRVGQLLERHLLPRVYRRHPVITIADSTRQEIVERYGIAEEQITVTYMGVEDRFCPGGERSPVPMLVAVARMMPQKGLAEMMDIAMSVRARVPDLVTVLVGDGPQAAELRAKHAALGSPSWMRFAGRVDDDELVAWYRRAWVVASASFAEGFGLTLTEAAGCATPVVASDIPGHRDAVADGIGGVLAARGEPMADAIVELLTDPARWSSFSQGALCFARRFSWANMALSAYEVLCVDAERRNR